MSTEPDVSQATGRGSIPVDSFGNRLMLARAHAGHISIREAADLCGIGRGAWTNWEKGARPVDIIEVTAVVGDKLGVDRDWLLFGGSLGLAETRSLRRSIRRGEDAGTNQHSSTVGRSDDPKRVRHLSPRPFGPSRRDRNRPVSAIPVTRRRPSPVRPGERAIAV